MQQIKDLLEKNHLKFIFLSLVFIFLLAVRDYPYFNILLGAKTNAVIIIILSVILFSIKSCVLFKAALFLLFPALVLNLLGFLTSSEEIGELIYLLLVLAIIKRSHD